MRKGIKILAIAALFIAIAGSFLYWQETQTRLSNNQTTPLPTPTITPTPASTPNVKITNFTCLGIWHVTDVGAFLDLFSLSYTNLGNSDAQKLTVTLNTSKTTENYADLPYNSSNPEYNSYHFLDEDINGKIYRLYDLQANETRTIEKSFPDDVFLLVEPFNLTATLKSNNTILDEATIIIPLNDINT